MTKTVILLGGPRGGSGIALAHKIANHLETRITSTFGRRYVVHVEATDGYSENVNRIQMDKSGQSIGLGHDGFENTESVKTLLPLDRQYLHLICNKELYDRCAEKKLPSVPVPSSEAPCLSDIAGELLKDDSELRYCVYLGPYGSGTRWTAGRVLSSYNIDSTELMTHGVANWYELEAAFASGSVKLGFVLGPKNAESVKRIADNGNTILLSIDQADAICDFNSQLETAKFSKQSYSTAFTTHQLETVSAKRVFVCSSTLDQSDAFFLARHISEGLGLSDVGWSSTEINHSGYGLHPGAQLLKNKETPRWVQSLSYVWLTFGVWIVLSAITEIASRINRNLEPNDGVRSDPSSGNEVDQENALEDIGDRMASEMDVLDDAIIGVRKAFLSEEIRSAYLDIVARFSEANENARTTVASLITDKNAPVKLRKDAIQYAKEMTVPYDAILVALNKVVDERSLGKAAESAIEKLSIHAENHSELRA